MNDRLLLVFVSQLILITSSYCQSNGVYLTAADFEDGKITSIGDGSDETVVENNDGSISQSSKSHVKIYKFGTIYGFIKDGVKFRTYGSKRKFFSTYGYCKMLDESALMIYSKSSRHRRSSGYVWHYYSIIRTSEIRLLTLRNLKADFPGNAEFLDIMERSMKRKDYLRKYNGKLLINEIYTTKVVNK